MTFPKISYLCRLTLAVALCSNCYMDECTGQEVPLHLFSKPNLVAVKSRGLSTRYFSEPGNVWAEYLAVSDRTYISSIRAKMPSILASPLIINKLDALDFRKPRLVVIRQDNTVWFIPEPLFAEHLAHRLRAGLGDVLGTMTLDDYQRKLSQDPRAKEKAREVGQVSVHIRTANELSDWSVPASELRTISLLKGSSEKKPWRKSTNRQRNVLYVVMHQPASLAERWILVAASNDSLIFGAAAESLQNAYQGPVFASAGDSVFIIDPINIDSLQPITPRQSAPVDGGRQSNVCKLIQLKGK